MLRKPFVLLIALASILSVLAMAGPASASAAQRIDMKVLLLGTSTTEPDFVSWQAALQREGVPFDTIVTSAGHAPITAATLSGTLADGTPEGKYQADHRARWATSRLCTTTCVSTLSQTEWAAIEEYEQTFNVRQLTGDVFPGATYGLNSPTVSGALDGAQGSLTSRRQNGLPLSEGSRWRWTPAPTATRRLRRVRRRTNFDTLVTGPSGSSLVGIYTHPDGVQEWSRRSTRTRTSCRLELLRHGALELGDARGVLRRSAQLLRGEHRRQLPRRRQLGHGDSHQIDYDAGGRAARGPQTSNTRRTGRPRTTSASTCCSTAAAASVGGTPDTGIDPLLAEFRDTTRTRSAGSTTRGITRTSTRAARPRTTSKPRSTRTTAFATTALGLTASTSPTAALGNKNPSVIVTGEHSGLANLAPGNPGVVDPAQPLLSRSGISETKGTLPAGTYVYGVTDDFAANGGQSIATVSAPVAVTGANGTVTLSWQAVCHSAQFKVYREVAGSMEAKPWKLIATISAPSQAPPNAWFANPTVNTLVAGGGSQEVTFTDTGTAGTASSGPPAVSESVETPYPQNPNLIPAFTGVGIQYFGSDASKPYPNPTIAGSTTAAITAGSTFTDGPAQAIPRYPTNIYYNVSTEAEAVDEYNPVYMPTAQGGKCVASATTTCETKAGELRRHRQQRGHEHVRARDGQRPAAALLPPDEHDGHAAARSADHRNPPGDRQNRRRRAVLLGAEPAARTVQQVLQRADRTADDGADRAAARRAADLGQANTARSAATSKATRSRSTTPARPPSTPRLTGVTGVGSAYGGISSGWTSVPAAASTHTAPTTWPVRPRPCSRNRRAAGSAKSARRATCCAGWDGAQDVSNLPERDREPRPGQPLPVGGEHDRRPRAAGARRPRPATPRPTTSPNEGQGEAELRDGLQRQPAPVRGRLGPPGAARRSRSTTARATHGAL